MAQTPEQIASKLKQNRGGNSKQWGGITNAERLKMKEKRAALVEKIQKRSGDQESGDQEKETPPTE